MQVQPEQKECPYKFSVEETEEGYAIHFKGNKEKLKARLEALEAYHRFREKARAAGFNHHSSHNCDRGFLALIHKHIQAFHRRSHTRPAPEAAE